MVLFSSITTVTIQLVLTGPGLFELSLNVLVFAKTGFVLITEVLTNVTFQIKQFINGIIKL